MLTHLFLRFYHACNHQSKLTSPTPGLHFYPFKHSFATATVFCTSKNITTYLDCSILVKLKDWQELHV